MYTRILLACFLLLFASASQARIFSSVGANGVTQYSDTCPKKFKCKVVKQSSTATSDTTSTTSTGTTSTTTSGTPSTSSTGTTSPAPNVLWSAGMEDGSMQEWYANGGGAENNGTLGLLGNGVYTPGGGPASDGSFSGATTERARSGGYSAKLSIPGTSGAVRLWRFKESRSNKELYYSVWYFVPQKYTVQLGGWTNWMQFKSATTDGLKHDPFFLLGMANRQSTRVMHLTLHWWHATLEGPAPGQFGKRTWSASVDMPIGRWFHIEVRHVSAGDFTGAIQVWQDGVEVFKLEGVKTRYSNGDTLWAVANYGQNILPSPVVFYVDDVAISNTRVGP